VDAGFRSVAGEHEGVVGVLSFEELPFHFIAGVISLLTHLLLSTPIYVLVIISYIYST